MYQSTKSKVLYNSCLVMILSCVVFAACFDNIFSSVLNYVLVLREGTFVFDHFTAPKSEISMNFYFFNVTNPDEITNYGAKPILHEIGPYVYREQFHKFDYKFDDAAGTVSYFQNATFFFVPEESVGTEEDKITTLNVLMVALGSGIDELNPGLRAFGQLLFLRYNLKEKLFITKTVSELLFTGFYDPLIDFLGPLTEDPALSSGKFGFYININYTNDGLYKVNTGAKDLDEYMAIQEFRNESHLSLWGDEFCGMINGTEGRQFPPGVKKDKTLHIFIGEACRSFKLAYEKERILHGIPLYRFSLPPESLAISTDACLCSDELTCSASMMSIKRCKKGAPVVVSAPHFYQRESDMLEKFEGLSPSKILHETFLDVEPTTGVMVSFAKRIQVNLPLKRYGNLPSFQNVPEVIFPIFWFDENGAMSKENAYIFHLVLHVLFVIVYSTCGILILLGILMVGLVEYHKLQNVTKFREIKNKFSFEEQKCCLSS